MSENEISFGLSFRDGPPDWMACLERCPKTLSDAIELPFVPDNVETAAAALDAFAVRRRHLSNPYPSSLTRSVADESGKFRHDFLASVSDLLDDARPLSINSVFMDFALDSIVGKEARHESRIRMLKDLAPILDARPPRLSLPLRFPFVSAEIGWLHQRVLTESLCPNLRICLNIRAHESPKDFSPSLSTRWVKFDLDAVRFVYEADLGNRLVPKLVDPWLAFLRDVSFNGSVLFAPRAANEELFASEIERCRRLIDE